MPLNRYLGNIWVIDSVRDVTVWASDIYHAAEQMKPMVEENEELIGIHLDYEPPEL